MGIGGFGDVFMPAAELVFYEELFVAYTCLLRAPGALESAFRPPRSNCEGAFSLSLGSLVSLGSTPITFGY